MHETTLKSAVWQDFEYIFDGDNKLKDAAGCFMCKNCVPTLTQIMNFKLHQA
jgi:hypothetical protein